MLSSDTRNFEYQARFSRNGNAIPSEGCQFVIRFVYLKVFVIPLNQQFADNSNLGSCVNKNCGILPGYSPGNNDLIPVSGVADVIYVRSGFEFLGPGMLPGPWEFKAC